MSKKELITRKLKAKRDWLASLPQAVYHGEAFAGNLARRAVNAFRIFIVSARKFIADDCFTKASSITYTIVLSLVPMMAVGLAIFTFIYNVGKNKKDLFDRLLLIMAEYNIKMNVDPVFETILGLVENAGKIGGISAVMMIFSATAMFRSLESSLNGIWNVRKGRPIHLQVIYYWAALTLGPVILAAAMYVATLVSSVMLPANFTAAAADDDHRVWVIGSHSSILVARPDDNSFTPVAIDGGAVDFMDQKIYGYQPADRSFVPLDETIKPRRLKKTEFRSIQFLGKKGWIVGTNGIVLITWDGGASWQVRKFHDFNFNAIRMIGDQRGFIAADNGRVLSTNDGGYTWEVAEHDGMGSLTGISFMNERGIITGSRGYVLMTYNAGKTWSAVQLKEARRHGHPVDLSAPFFESDRNIWIAGNDGTLLNSNDGGAHWSRKTVRDLSYRAILFFNPEEGVAAGDQGALVRTKNGGQTWDGEEMPALKVKALLYRDGRLWAAGDSGTVMMSKNHGETWTVLKKGMFPVTPVINFMAPFLFIWLLFLLAYVTIPNTRVPIKPAAIGATFTAAVWVGFIQGFIIYVRSFADSTVAVYGALAAIPLSLLMIYSSSMIVLFGAEVSYTLMYPETYRSLKKRRRREEEMRLYIGIALLRQIYGKYESGGGPSSAKNIHAETHARPDEIDRYLEIFREENLLAQNAEGDFMPATNSGLVSIRGVIDLIMSISMDIPAGAERSHTGRMLAKLFKSLKENRGTVIGELTLKDLID